MYPFSLKFGGCFFIIRNCKGFVYGGYCCVASTNRRGLIKLIVWGTLTLGVYPLIVEAHISEELNTVINNRDGRHTMHFS